MFVIKPILFSIGTITINLITLTCLNLIEHLYVLHVPSYILVELISILHVHIIISFNIFKKHLPKTFFQLEIEEMEIDETLV